MIRALARVKAANILPGAQALAIDTTSATEDMLNTDIAATTSVSRGAIVVSINRTENWQMLQVI